MIFNGFHYEAREYMDGEHNRGTEGTGSEEGEGKLVRNSPKLTEEEVDDDNEGNFEVVLKTVSRKRKKMKLDETELSNVSLLSNLSISK